MMWETGSVHVLLSREQLYALVWTEPVRTLAPKLGISDVALAKHCEPPRVCRSLQRPSRREP